MLYSIGLMFIVIGFIFKMFPPRKINYIYGYRTNLSMKNQDIWNEAQKYSANSFIVLGFIYVTLGFILSLTIRNIGDSYNGMILIIGIIIMIIFDEGHLRKIFNNDGSRRL